MKYLIVEPNIKAIANNIALMKWARWCENEGIEYQYVRGRVQPDIIPDKIIMSCIFTYYSKLYAKTINYYRRRFSSAEILIGGVFPTLMPQWFNNFNKVKIHQGMLPILENITPKYNVIIKNEEPDEKLEHNRKTKIVLYASRGCVNKCGFCAVPILEGGMHSLKSIKQQLEIGMKELPNADNVVLYDNNFTEHAYFDNIIDELKEFGLPVDIHGLHASSFDKYKAAKLSELKWGSQGNNGTAYIRFGFDTLHAEKDVKQAYNIFVKSGIKANFFCYVLFNWIDKPSDFYKRIMIAKELVEEKEGYIYLFPQRYEPLRALEKYKYIGKYWTPQQVKGIKRLVTFLHGFLPVSCSDNLFDWIGHTEKEFWYNVKMFGKDNKYKLDKTREDFEYNEKELSLQTQLF